jgi:hypothetical protein
MLRGYLSEFSLGELFQVLEYGKKTGKLSLITKTKDKLTPNKNYLIWFHQGKVIAASNRLDYQGLISLIKRRSWIEDKEISRLPNLRTLTLPLGLYLKSKGLVKTEDLQLIFRLQVMREITPLFQISDAEYKFKEERTLPFAEMTGLNIGAKELIFRGLRSIRDWNSLKDKLPQSTSGLIPKKNNKLDLDLELDATESQLWELCQQKLSIAEMAKKTAWDMMIVQQTAFRLIMIGLAEEIPFINSTIPNKKVDLAFETGITRMKETNCPTSDFMQNLMNFLEKTK